MSCSHWLRISFEMPFTSLRRWMLNAPSPITCSRNTSEAADNRTRIERRLSAPIPREIHARGTRGSSGVNQPSRYRFHRGLDPGGNIELAAGSLDVEIDVALAGTDDQRDFARCLATRRPGKTLQLTLVEGDIA